LRGLVLLAVVCSADLAHVNAGVTKSINLVQCPAAVIPSDGRVVPREPADMFFQRYPFPVQDKRVKWPNWSLKRRPRMVGGLGPKVLAEIVPLSAVLLDKKVRAQGDALTKHSHKALYVQRYKNSAEWAIFAGDELASLRRVVEAALLGGGGSEREHDLPKQGKFRAIRPRVPHFQASSRPLEALAPGTWSGYHEEGTRGAIGRIFDVMQEKMRSAVDGDFARFLNYFTKNEYARTDKYLGGTLLENYITKPDPENRYRDAVAWLVRGVWGGSSGATVRPFPVVPEDKVMHDFVRQEAKNGDDAGRAPSKSVLDAKGAAAKARTRASGAPDLRDRAEGAAATSTSAEATVVFWKEVEDALEGEDLRSEDALEGEDLRSSGTDDLTRQVFERVKQLGTRMIVYSELYPDWTQYENEAKRICDRDAVELTQLTASHKDALESDLALQAALPASLEGLGMEEWEAVEQWGSFGKLFGGPETAGGWFYTRERADYGYWNTQPTQNPVARAASGVGNVLMGAGALVRLLIVGVDSDPD